MGRRNEPLEDGHGADPGGSGIGTQQGTGAGVGRGDCDAEKHSRDYLPSLDGAAARRRWWAMVSAAV